MSSTTTFSFTIVTIGEISPTDTVCPGVSKALALGMFGFAIKNSSIFNVLSSRILSIESPSFTVYSFCFSIVPNNKNLLISFSFVKYSRLCLGMFS